MSQDQEERYQATRKTVNRYRRTSVVLLVLSFTLLYSTILSTISSIKTHTALCPWIFLTTAVCLIAAIFHLKAFSVHSKILSAEKITAVNLTQILESMGLELTHQPNSFIPPAMLARVGIIDDKSFSSSVMVWGRDLLSGNYKGFRLLTSFIDISRTVRYGTHCSRITLYSGQIAIIYRPRRAFPGTMLMLGHQLPQLPSLLSLGDEYILSNSGVKDCHLRDIPQLGEPIKTPWMVYSDNPEAAERLLDPEGPFLPALLENPWINLVVFVNSRIALGTLNNLRVISEKKDMESLKDAEEIRARCEKSLRMILADIDTVLLAEEIETPLKKK